MTGPRNRPAFARGQRAREAIREILAGHSPLLKPLTLDELRQRLRERRIYAAISTIAYHRERIWLEEEAKGWKFSNSSLSTEPLS